MKQRLQVIHLVHRARDGRRLGEVPVARTKQERGLSRAAGAHEEEVQTQRRGDAGRGGGALAFLGGRGFGFEEG